MSTQRSSLTQRASRFTVTGPAPGTAPPAHRRVMTAGLAAAALSLAADVVLVAIGGTAFTVPASFDKFAFGTYALLTVLGVAGATLAWDAVTRLSSRPTWLLTRLAALVTALFLIPDFLLLGTPGNPAGPVAILMLMHLAIAVVTYTALIKIAPVRRVGLSVMEPSWPPRITSRSQLAWRCSSRCCGSGASAPPGPQPCGSSETSQVIAGPAPGARR